MVLQGSSERVYKANRNGETDGWTQTDGPPWKLFIFIGFIVIQSIQLQIMKTHIMWVF